MILDKILRAGEGRILRKLKAYANAVNAIEEDYAELTDAELRELTDEFKRRHADGQSLEDLLPEAFAVVREAASRVLGQRHYDVQLMGGAALHLGNIAEMRTGEGKTLVSTLPAYLNALSCQGVHIITVNDYLAQRDSEWMGRIHRFLGLSVGVVLAGQRPDEHRAAYECDITYGTNNEFGFDYLRDNMAWSKSDMVQRGHNFAIVDEVDSILIDEARTPLIISGPAEQSARWYTEFARIVPRLKRDVDYEVDEKKRTVGISESGVQKVEDQLGIENLYEAVNTPLVGYLNNALKASELFRADRDYIVVDGEVLIVDEHTGRILHGRRYNEGMHQAIEAKEGVKIKDENQTLATITLQNYFRMYSTLSGMTGTAMTEAAEFQKVYRVGVVPIPTHRPMVRKDQADVIYKTEEAKFEAVVEDIVERNEKGQPVLVGTVSVEKSEMLSTMLRRRGVPHAVLNAKYHAREAEIVAQAGRKGAVTVATNMAGRGTDILLGGNPEYLAAAELRQRGYDQDEDPEAYTSAWSEALAKAEGQAAEENTAVVGAGGLYVLGTERHESRRIDNQLRGRSGRQGDPGESRFYLSLGDDLMRRFNAGAVEAIMDRLNIPDDVPIESKLVTRQILSAQTQIEQQNAEIRKNVLKYDEVLNKQRQVIYVERKKVLDGQDLQDQVRHMIESVVEAYVVGATAEGYSEDWELDQLLTALKLLYPVSLTLEDLEEEAGGKDALSQEFLVSQLVEDAQAAYDKREEEIGVDRLRELERQVLLTVLDRKWREHLYEMDYLQEGIGLRAYAQRDPLVEYQREGFDLFGAMMDGIKEESVGFLFSVEVKVEEEERPALSGVQDGTQAAQLQFTAKGLGQRGPQKLLYSAPALDGAAGAGSAVVTQGNGEGSAFGLDEAPQTAAAGGRTRGRGQAAKSVGRTTARAGAARAGATKATAAKAGAAKPGAAGRPAGAVRSSDAAGPGAAPRSGPKLGPASATAVGAKTAARGQAVGSGTPRNAPCPCGSGKKFKKCHGAPVV